jgi:ABC-type transport system substrate-binding protein
LIGIEIDERPLSLDRPTVPDYVGRMVLGALYRPLLNWDRAGGEASGLLAHCCASQDQRSWRLQISEDAAWSDGSPITAADAMRGLAAAAAHPFWCRFLSALESLEVASETELVLVVRLSHPLPFFPQLLTAVDLSPRRPDNARSNVYSGTHMLAEDAGDKIVVLPNPTRSSALSPPLRFTVNRRPEETLAGFAEGRWDITSPTGVPPANLARSTHGRRRCVRSGIFVQVEFLPRGRLFWAAALRRALFLALDAEAFRDAALEGFHPMSAFGPSCFEATAALSPSACNPAAARALWRRKGGPDRIVVGYNPYYPNLELLEACARRWGDELNLSVTPEPFRFGADTPQHCDAVIALRFPAFPHPWAVLDQYVRLAEAQTGKAHLWRKAADWLSRDDDDVALTRLVEGLARVMPVVPLGEIICHWIEREGVHGFEPRADGSISLDGLRRH